MSQIIQLANGKTISVSWWQVALLAIAVSGVSRLFATTSPKKSQVFYSEILKQAPWSPPGWLFGPAWTLINFFLLWGLVKILNLGSGSTKYSLLAMQVFIWVLFYSFDYVYFNRKSPILAALWTNLDLLLALCSLLIAWYADRNLAYCYLPLGVWTLYAGTVADYQALYNGDPVFNTKPLLEYLNGKNKK
jgi:translocator protein